MTLLLVVVAILCVGLLFLTRFSKENEGLSANQEAIYAEIVTANGNEITYRLTTVDEETSQDAENFEENMKDMSELTEEERSEMFENMPEMNGEAGGDFQGTPPVGDGEGMPDMSELSEEERSEMLENMSEMDGERPEMNGERPGSDEVSTAGNDITEETSYTVTIPVGTEVTTKLGTVTTFSWLKAGDVIKMIVEEMKDGSEEIISIEILE